jgi:hypothetical protein
MLVTISHRHQVTGIDPRPPYLCECGAEWNTTSDRWVASKTEEGKRRQAAWEEAE